MKAICAPIEDALAAIADGRMIVVVDDENRENEGDIVVAAEKVTDKTINFMAMHGRGLICTALTPERLDYLGLARMRNINEGDKFNTAFMESVDAREGVTTGISAGDRARTIQLLVSPEATRRDFVSPGHTFPLAARDGGVLRRAGHTEAAVDLAHLAGLAPAGVICEILRDDGQMARLPDLTVFAKKHGLCIISVADLIAYRRRREKLVRFVRKINLPTAFGDFTLHLYESITDGDHHLALVMGEPKAGDVTLVRVHSECLTGDALGSLRCDCGGQLKTAMQMVADEGNGVIVYMRQEGRGIGLANKIHAYELQDQGMDTVEANEHLGFEADLRDYGLGAQILADLGLHRIRLLTNNPRKIIGLEGYGLHVVERVPLILAEGKHSTRYLQTKKNKLGHLI